jgi:hypothetical protein
MELRATSSFLVATIKQALEAGFSEVKISERFLANTFFSFLEQFSEQTRFLIEDAD